MSERTKKIFSALGCESWLLAAILLLTLVLRLRFVHVPLDRDEGTYIVLGQEVFRGAVPYRDAIEMKLPGFFYLYGLITLFGNSVEYIRVVTALYSLLTVIFTYLLARAVANGRSGLCAALLCGIFSCGPVVQGNGSNLEVFLLLPIMAGVYLLFRGFDSGQRRYFAASGLLLAAAVFIKTIALPVYLLPLLFLPFVRRSQRGWRAVTRDAGAYAAPGALLGLLLVVYLAANGAWDDFIYWNFTFARAYAKSSWPVFWGRLATRGLATASEFLPLWVAALPGLCWLLVKRPSYKSCFLAGLVAASVVAVCMPGKFWPHYLIPLIPPLSVAAGIGIAALFEGRRAFLYGGLPLLALSCYPTLRLDYPYYAATPEQVSALEFGSDVFVRAAEVARYVRKRTAPDDTIFQWGWEPEIYVTADRRPPNRFLSHLTAVSSPDPNEAVQQLTESILSKRPKYIIVQAGRERVPGYPELAGILQARYLQETTIGGYLVYRLTR